VSARLNVDEAVAALADGRIVALPTDTVYGVGASLAQPAAVAALFALKERPTSVALPVVADSSESVRELATRWPDGAARLSRKFWPGALTLVVGAGAPLCELVRSESHRVGFRVPADAAVIEVVRRSGPLALTSANLHGATPCVTADEVLAQFVGREELFGVLDAGRRDAVVSTVVEFDGDAWSVLRHGAIAESAIAAALA
jgi:L-threonylcarbamoyladenylate synthase